MDNTTELSKGRREFLKLGAAILALPLVKREPPAQSDQDLVERKFDLDGSEVTFLGVHHDIETYLRHREFFEKKIGEADIVVSEVLPFELSWKEEGSLIRHLIDEKSFEFFRAIVETSRRKGKPLVGVDPLNTKETLASLDLLKDYVNTINPMVAKGF